MASKKLQRGVTLIEMLGALAVGTSMLSGLVFWIDTSLEDTKSQQAALYQQRFTSGVDKFISDPVWNAFIKTNATTAVPVKVQVANLTAGNFLPAGTGTTNSYNQTPCGLIYYNSATNRIDALLTTEGGEPIPEKQLGYVASNAGDGAGYVSTTTPTLAKGAYGGWETPLAAYTDGTATKNCSGTAATGGRLATMVFQEASGSLQSEFLYRDSVPGRPDLNTMNTPVIMSDSTIQTVGNACTTNGAIGRNADGAVVSCVNLIWKTGGSAYWADPVANWSAITALACTAAEAGQTRVVRTATVGAGPRAYTCNGAGSWQPLALDDAGNIVISGTATINAMNGNLQITASGNENVGCVGEGRIAVSTTTSGLILSCQSGVWKKLESSWSSMASACTTNGYVYTGGSCKAISTFAASTPPSIPGCPIGFYAVGGYTTYLYTNLNNGESASGGIDGHGGCVATFTCVAGTLVLNGMSCGG